MTNPYSRFEIEDLILRDELAIDRTILANERTLLAYLRSGVALILAGASFIHFSQQGWYQVIGIACLPVSLVVMAIGAARYRRVGRHIGAVRTRLVSTPRSGGPESAPESGSRA